MDKMDAAVDYGVQVIEKVDKAVEPTVKKITPYMETLESKMQPIINRPVDWILFLYFTSHIPITLFFDLQPIYPKWWIPSFLTEVNGSYIKLLGDPYMDISKPAMYWFKSFAYCEAFLQLPFFFFAAYGVFKDKSWIRLPLAIYGAHVMTTVVPCLAELVFNQELYQLSNFQRNCLFALYFPYFLIPFIAVIDSTIRITQKLRQLDKQLIVKKDK